MPLKSPTVKKMKRRPCESGDQNVALLHRGGILRNHGQNSNSPETSLVSLLNRVRRCRTRRGSRTPPIISASFRPFGVRSRKLYTPIKMSPSGRTRKLPRFFLSVGRLLRPTGGRVLKVLLPPVGCRIEKAVGVLERFAAARVHRIRVENVVVEAEEDA